MLCDTEICSLLQAYPLCVSDLTAQMHMY